MHPVLILFDAYIVCTFRPHPLSLCTLHYGLVLLVLLSSGILAHNLSRFLHVSIDAYVVSILEP